MTAFGGYAIPRDPYFWSDILQVTINNTPGLSVIQWKRGHGRMLLCGGDIPGIYLEMFDQDATWWKNKYHKNEDPEDLYKLWHDYILEIVHETLKTQMFQGATGISVEICDHVTKSVIDEVIDSADEHDHEEMRNCTDCSFEKIFKYPDTESDSDSEYESDEDSMSDSNYEPEK